MNWFIIEGCKVFYINLFKYDFGVDLGDVMDMFKFEVGEKDMVEIMYYKNMLVMKYLIECNIECLVSNDF